MERITSENVSGLFRSVPVFPFISQLILEALDRLIAVRYQTKTNELPYSVSASSLVQPAMSNISDFSDFDHDCVSIWSELEGRGIVVHSAASAFATLWFLDGKANFLTQNDYA